MADSRAATSWEPRVKGRNAHSDSTAAALDEITGTSHSGLDLERAARAAKGRMGLEEESRVAVPTLPLSSSVALLSHLISGGCSFLTCRRRGRADDSRIPFSHDSLYSK